MARLKFSPGNGVRFEMRGGKSSTSMSAVSWLHVLSFVIVLFSVAYVGAYSHEHRTCSHQHPKPNEVRPLHNYILTSVCVQEKVVEVTLISCFPENNGPLRNCNNC